MTMSQYKKILKWLIAAIVSTIIGLLVTKLISVNPKVHTELFLVDNRAQVNIKNGRKELKNVAISINLWPRDIEIVRKNNKEYNLYDDSLEIISLIDPHFPIGYDYKIDQEENIIEVRGPLLQKNERIRIRIMFEYKAKDKKMGGMGVSVRAEGGLKHRETIMYSIYNNMPLY